MSLILQIQQAGTALTDTLNQAAAAIPPVTGDAAPTLSFLDLLIKGGFIMIPIGILSIAGLFIFFERLFTIRKFSNIDQNFLNQIRDFMHQGNIDAAKSLCK